MYFSSVVVLLLEDDNGYDWLETVRRWCLSRSSMLIARFSTRACPLLTRFSVSL
jgi:hypothetical protein